MSMVQHITTLVSAGRHPVSGEPRHCRNDSVAMTIGLSLAQSILATHRVLHAGDADNQALSDYLALGAGQIEVIPTSAETDVLSSLAAQLNRTDLILTGSRAENGEDSGLLPYLLAHQLGIPLVANALAIKVSANLIEVLQFLPKGKRRNVSVTAPAIIAVHPLAPTGLQFSYARQLAGKIKILPSSSALTNPADRQPDAWQTQAALRKPIKLHAAETKSGHERMLAAISTESKGGAVVNDGNSVEKAQVILRYLREHHLINF